jgi:hypothetical protein
MFILTININKECTSWEYYIKNAFLNNQQAIPKLGGPHYLNHLRNINEIATWHNNGVKKTR